MVTGGGFGIGAAITRTCLEEGAKVIVAGRLSDAAKEFRDEMESANAACDSFDAELAEPEQCRLAVSCAQERYGRLDGLVNNAGANDGIGLSSGSPERFMESRRQNLLHYYAMAHYALPLLKESKGSIVNISSKVALTSQVRCGPWQ